MLRAARDISQAELSRRAGLSKAALSYLESGKRDAQAGTLQFLAEALEVPPAALDNDMDCFREIARLCGVQGVSAGEPAPGGELATLLERIAPEQRAGAVRMIEGLLQAMTPPKR